MADDSGSSEVVLRRSKDRRNKLDFGLGIDVLDGKKKVKWSDSTELREKMKEYRRSQLSICLDYQHIVVEEEREREGVKKWRETKDIMEKTEEEEEDDSTNQKDIPTDVPDGIAPDEDNGDGEDDGFVDSDSDDDPYCDEVLEAKLRVIKAKASRHTLLPAYTVAVNTYEEWLGSDSSSTLSQEQRSNMTSQLDRYKQVLDLYGQWNDSAEMDKIDKCFQAVLLKLADAKKLCEPPKEVVSALESVLNNEENVKKHKELYSSMVDDMVTDLSKQIQTTTL